MKSRLIHIFAGLLGFASTATVWYMMAISAKEETGTGRENSFARYEPHPPEKVDSNNAYYDLSIPDSQLLLTESGGDTSEDGRTDCWVVSLLGNSSPSDLKNPLGIYAVYKDIDADTTPDDLTIDIGDDSYRYVAQFAEGSEQEPNQSKSTLIVRTAMESAFVYRDLNSDGLFDMITERLGGIVQNHWLIGRHGMHRVINRLDAESLRFQTSSGADSDSHTVYWSGATWEMEN